MFFFFLTINIFFCYVGCKLYIKLAENYNIIDSPNERTNHEGEVPRGLGIIIVPVSLAFTLIFLNYNYNITSNIYIYILLTILSCIFFFAEDIGNISIIFRLVAQIFFVGCGTYLLRENIISLAPTIPYAWKNAAIIIGWLWFMNLYNFMDGIDGITAIETISIMVGILIMIFFGHFLYNEGSMTEKIFLAKQTIYNDYSLNYYKWPLLFLLSGMMVFSFFNYGKAKAFIGDSGSISLGFFLGGILIKFGDEYTLFGALILPLYYIMDATITILYRLYLREKIWLPHTKHFFQLAKRAGYSNHIICKKIIILNITLIILTILQVSSRGNTIAALFLFVVAIIITVLLLRNFKNNYL